MKQGPELASSMRMRARKRWDQCHGWQRSPTPWWALFTSPAKHSLERSDSHTECSSNLWEGRSDSSPLYKDSGAKQKFRWHWHECQHSTAFGLMGWLNVCVGWMVAKVDEDLPPGHIFYHTKKSYVDSVSQHCPFVTVPRADYYE